jgi:hypothetical protein
MQSKTTLEVPPAAPALDDALRQALPSVVVGETAEVERTHEWPGTMFVILSYVAAVGLAASAVGSVGWGLFTGDAGLGGWAVGAGVWSVLQWKLARAVQNFSRWGWYGAMAELGAAAAAKVWTFASTGEVVGPAIGLVIDALWIGYFWERREQFDVDMEL